MRGINSPVTTALKEAKKHPDPFFMAEEVESILAAAGYDVVPRSGRIYDEHPEWLYIRVGQVPPWMERIGRDEDDVRWNWYRLVPGEATP